MTSAIGKPGTPSGPCPNSACGEPHCTASRARAAAPCRLCREPLGYGRLLVREGAQVYSHAECVDKAHKAAVAKLQAPRRAA